MKKLLFLLFAPLAALAQQPAGYVVTGKITGLKDSTEVTLVDPGTAKVLARTKVRNGGFILKGQATEPTVYQLKFQGQKNFADFFMYNEPVTVTGDISNIAAANIKASAYQEDFVQFKNQFVPLLQRLQGLAGVINPERDQQKRDSLIREYTLVKNEAMNTTISFVKAKKASPVSALVLSVMAPLFGSILELEPYYASLEPAAHRGPFARELEKALADAKIGSVGTMAMDFTQKDVNDKPVSLSSFRGKYVLVDFWASWCRPCRAENPNVVSAYNTYKDKNFTVLGVSLDQSKPNWLQAINADNLTWTHVSDLQYWSNAVAQLYHVQSIPANFLIDPNGRIVGRDLRGEDLKNALKQLLK